MAAIERVPVQTVTAAANPWVVLAVVCTGVLMIMVNTTIVNIAVPSIISGLQATLDQVLWAINAYLLVFAVLLVPADWATSMASATYSRSDFSALPPPRLLAASPRTRPS